jgi:hypothetical protein
LENLPFFMTNQARILATRARTAPRKRPPARCCCLRHLTMCGPDHPTPDGDYSTHEGIVAAMADENYVT